MYEGNGSVPMEAEGEKLEAKNPRVLEQVKPSVSSFCPALQSL